MDDQDVYYKLQQLGQEQLLANFKLLSAFQKQHLAHQILSINTKTFHQQKSLLNPSKNGKGDLVPFTDYAQSGNSIDKKRGQQLIAEGKVGCLIVAGGQGTRLRFDGPKGMFPISSIKHKSLFQMFVEKVIAAGKQANRLLPLAIMTSPLNHDQTVNFFTQNSYFGLKKEQIDFFQQSMLPFLNQEGNLFLESADTIAWGPDGNGGALEQFVRCGAYEKWYGQGVRYLNFVLIDNPLADPFDAELIGYHDRLQSDVIVKCALKSHADEKVGVLAQRDHKTIVIEYTEMEEKERTAISPQGTLLYSCANLSLFSFKMDFIADAVQNASLPLHKALKPAYALNEEIKAWKFEKYIFDYLAFSNKVSALLYQRENCFAPLKNFSGEASPKTVQEALKQKDISIMEDLTGTKFEGDRIEIAQDFYYPTPEIIHKWKNRFIPEGYFTADLIN